MSIQYGDTYIITNANQNWVDFSAAKYYPSTTEDKGDECPLLI